MIVNKLNRLLISIIFLSLLGTSPPSNNELLVKNNTGWTIAIGTVTIHPHAEGKIEYNNSMSCGPCITENQDRMFDESFRRGLVLKSSSNREIHLNLSQLRRLSGRGKFNNHRELVITDEIFWVLPAHLANAIKNLYELLFENTTRRSSCREEPEYKNRSPNWMENRLVRG